MKLSKKGISPLLSTMLLLAITFVAIALVMGVANPTIGSAKESSKIKESRQIEKLLADAINEVKKEGAGAKRLLKFNSPGEYEVVPQEDAISFAIETDVPVLDYLSRKSTGNSVQVSGADVKCLYGLSNMTLENSFLKVVFNYTAMTTPAQTMHTKNAILLMQEKTFNSTVSIVNSTVLIDDNSATSNGTGYSEILRSGQDMPSCTVHFFVNSTSAYDVYYTLYAGADFVVADIRNVR